MVNTSSVMSSSMFVKSLEDHLYGGSYIPPGYKSLSSAFSSVASSPWTSPMSSNLGIMSGTSLMNATKSVPLPPFTPAIEQHPGPYISGKIYHQ